MITKETLEKLKPSDVIYVYDHNIVIKKLPSDSRDTVSVSFDNNIFKSYKIKEVLNYFSKKRK